MRTRTVFAAAAVLGTLAFAASAQAAYLTLGTTNTSSSPTTLTGSGAPELKVVETNASNQAVTALAGGGSGIALFGTHTTAAGDRGQGLVGGVRVHHLQLRACRIAGEGSGGVRGVARPERQVGGLGARGEGEGCRGRESSKKSALEHRPFLSFLPGDAQEASSRRSARPRGEAEYGPTLSGTQGRAQGARAPPIYYPC